MVIYDLICSQGHRFEGWFPGHQSFDEQREMGLLECNVCGDHHVQKVLSGGHFVKSVGSAPSRKLVKNPVATATPVHNGMAASGVLDSVTVLKAIKHYVKTHFEDVGAEFSKKVKEMHAGQTPYQNIYGTATPEEQKKLSDEDIPHFLIPDLPPEFNN